MNDRLDLQMAIKSGARVLMTKAFAMLFPEARHKKLIALSKLPLTIQEVLQQGAQGWGQFNDILLAVPEDLPVVGYVGQTVVFGGSSRDTEVGYADFVYSSLDAELWLEALDGEAEEVKQNLVWTDLIVLKNENAFAGSYQRPILFLDRDNVIVPDVPYNTNPDLVSLNEGIVELIDRAHNLGLWVAMVSNQSGLGRGKIRFDQFGDVHLKMQQLLAEKSQWIDFSDWAGFISASEDLEGLRFAQYRKPRPGMFWKVQRQLKGALRNSLMVGDSATDLLAAAQVGIEALYLLKTDKWSSEVKKLESLAPGLRFHVIDSLSQVEF